MFCVNCGKKLEEGDRFCTVCGWPVEQEESGGAAAQETLQPAAENAGADEQQPIVESAGEGAQPPEAENPAEEYQPFTGTEAGYQPPSYESPVENTQITPQGGFYQDPGQSYGQGYGQAYDYSGTPQGNVPGMGYGEPAKKKSVWKKVLLIAVPVLLLAVLIGSFSTFGANFFRKTFSSPESYFQYVMKRALRENAGTAGGGAF